MPSEPQSWRRRPGGPLIRRTLTIIGAAALLALFGWFWWKGVPRLYANAGGGSDAENARLSAVTTTRAALLAGFVGLGALGTFWLNSRVYRITARTFEVTERGQVTDRYSKAIEQLGSTTVDVRLGGIYALEQIAKDSARGEEDQATIVEVLAAFVRVHSHPVYRFRHHLSWLGQEKIKDAEEERYKAEEHVGQVPLPVDVQAAVTVLGRLTPARHADLSNAYLRGVQLAGADMTGAKLRGANLTQADMTGAKLGGVTWTNETIWPSEELRKEIQAKSKKVKTATGATVLQVQGPYSVPSSTA